jgi:hypothetical protein
MSLYGIPGECWEPGEFQGYYYMSPDGGYIDYFGSNEPPPLTGIEGEVYFGERPLPKCQPGSRWYSKIFKN